MITTTSTLINVPLSAKGKAMLIDKLNKHSTMKAIIITHTKALYGKKLNANMRKPNLIVAYQNLGTQTPNPNTTPNLNPC